MSGKAPEEESAPSSEPRSTLLAVVVSSKREATCTIYAPGVTVPERGSRWIKARGEAFVDLATCQ